MIKIILLLELLIEVEYFKEFMDVYNTLDESNRSIYKEGLDELEK